MNLESQRQSIVQRFRRSWTHYWFERRPTRTKVTRLQPPAGGSPWLRWTPRPGLIGPRGPVTLLDAFEGRRQLIAYYFMWHIGHPAPEQCEGCTWVTTQVRELSYLHSRDVTFAVFCQGPYEESARYRDFMGWEVPWYSALGSLETLLIGRRIGRMHIVCYLRQDSKVFETYWTTARGVEVMDNSYHLLDLTVYGRQRSGRTRRSAGHNSAPTRALAAAHPLGNRNGQADTPSRSGHDSQPGAPTI